MFLPRAWKSIFAYCPGRKEKENRPMNKKELAIQPYYGPEIELNNY